MAVCVFIGHRTWNLGNLLPQLQTAVTKVVQESDSVEFLFYHHNCTEPFYDRCLLAANWIKQRSRNGVRITMLVNSRHYDAFLRQDGYSVPLCMIDQAVPITVPDPSRRDYSQGYKTVMRGMLERADFVISGVYEAIFDTERNFLHHARDVLKRQIINVTDSKTEQAILERVPTLSQREQAVFQMVQGGMSQREIAAQLQLSSTRAQQIVRMVGHRLKEYAKARAWALDKQAGKTWTCCISDTGPASPEKLGRFAGYIMFLMARYRVHRFYIGRTFAASGFMDTLAQQLACFQDGCEIIEVANGESPLDDPLEPYRRSTSLRYTVEGAPGPDDAGEWQTNTYMMGQSDFCICDLAAAPDGYRIRDFVSRTERTVILDLGGEQFAGEGP